jgi:UDP-N-acetylmuramoyl-tripeptide--D-alanyl-D-alanine ligase
VFEIGMNHADEIAPLSRLVQPHAVCITTVGPVHLENFPDGEAGVARAKAEIFEGLAPDGVAIINADGPWFGMLKASAEARGARVLTFGSADDADARLLDFQPEMNGARVSVRLLGREYVFMLAQAGFHWGMNSLSVLLMLDALGVERETALAGLSDFQALEGRGRELRIEIGGGAFILIDESYNANPLSMAATLASLGQRKPQNGGRRVAALTDMLELGPTADQLHADLAEAIEAADVHRVFLAGPHMKALWDVLPEARRGAWAPDAASLAPRVIEAAHAEDIVMVKGSLGSRASIVAKALKALDQAEPERA